MSPEPRLSAEPGAAVAELVAADPYLIGVRHHSAALARVLDELLSAYAPDAIVIELPPEAADWIEWIAHPDTVAPMAFAVVSDSQAGAGGISFYPFADFSPELVALRWARTHGVPVVCGDLAAGAFPADDLPAPEAEPADDLTGSLIRAAGDPDSDATWDRLVEVPGVGATPEQLRRSALAFGWAYRGRADPHLLAREAAMRTAIRAARAEHGPRVTAITGSAHSPALHGALLDGSGAPAADAAILARWRAAPTTTALVPYSDDQLDSRSGYPSGIRDPQWQRTVLNHGHDPAALASEVPRLLTEMAAGIRAEGHPAGPGETGEAVRLALDLAALRGLPAPGRQELLEACTTVFAQGEVLGLGRVVARVAQRVLVGNAVGRLPADCPRSGLVAAFTDDLGRLRLPGAQDPGRELTLEPLRSQLDLAREIFLQRCDTAGIRYGTETTGQGVAGARAIGRRWSVAYTPGTGATLAWAGQWGVTLAQAAAGRLARPLRDPETLTHADLLSGLVAAAAGALPEVFTGYLTHSGSLAEADLAGQVGALALLDAIATGQIAGATVAGFSAVLPAVATLRDDLVQAAIRQVAGLAGSDDPDDARTLATLVAMIREHSGQLELGVRLSGELHTLAETGSALIRGAVAALHRQYASEQADPEPVGFAGWIEGAYDSAGRTALRRWLTGFLAAAPELPGADEAVAAELAAAVDDLADARFVARLPALRGGFDGLTAAARERLLAAFGGAVGRVVLPDLEVAPELLGEWAEEDQQAWHRLRAAGLASTAFGTETRWRLILGRRGRDDNPVGAALARSLDQLYGSGSGEGAAADRTTGGGRDPAYPSARVWGDALTDLFGEDVREDVVGAAATAGHGFGVSLLTEDSARPSVELLSTVLSLRGALSEETVARLRPVVARIVEQLARVLAQRLQPALRGLAGTRRTTRPTRRLDAPATIRRNLRHTVPTADGDPQLIAATPVFRQPMAKRSDWQVIVLVDVSGSMEPSTVFAALTAAIFTGVPALSVTFLAFSTEVIDLTEHVSDPLALLLEISIGGGTAIATGLRAARNAVRVPTRTMVVLITDFEEGLGSGEGVAAEVAALHRMGCRLIGCAALDDTGVARYNRAIAQQCVAAGMPVSALSPTALAGWVAEQVKL